VICAVTLLAGPATASASASAIPGLGWTVPAYKQIIALVDTKVHWEKPIKAGQATEYPGSGDQGRAEYDLTGIGGALYVVGGVLEAKTPSQAVQLADIQDVLTVPFAGKGEENWFDSEVQDADTGALPKVTKVFGNVRVGLGFSFSGSTLVLRVSVEPTNF
jgi:hypothetical protein